MNKHQAYEAMCQGHKVCNEYYTPEEYAFINQNGLIEYEDGCVVGNQFSENWVKYQDPECKFEWSICDDRGKPNLSIDEIDNKRSYFPNPIGNSYHIETPKPFVSKNSHKRTNKRK